MKESKNILIALLICGLLVGLYECSSRSSVEKTNDSTPQIENTIDSEQVQLSNQGDVAEIDDQEIVETPDLPIIEEEIEVEEKVKESKPAAKPAIEKKVNNIKPPVKKYAEMKFEAMEIDFGEITEGDIIERKFKFTNTGKIPLEITETHATCGCTRPSFPFINIAPGESNVIGVRYNSVGKDGDQKPEITVTANTKPATTTLFLTGTVVPKEKSEG